MRTLWKSHFLGLYGSVLFAPLFFLIIFLISWARYVMRFSILTLAWQVSATVFSLIRLLSHMGPAMLGRWSHRLLTVGQCPVLFPFFSEIALQQVEIVRTVWFLNLLCSNLKPAIHLDSGSFRTIRHRSVQESILSLPFIQAWSETHFCSAWSTWDITCLCTEPRLKLVSSFSNLH